MLELDEIRKFFPEYLHGRAKSLLREYLQCKILSLIFKSKLAHKLTFIGGTALRIVYNTQRFSEDLDFDNKGLNFDDWKELGSYIAHELILDGINIEVCNSRLNKTVFHHELRFPGLFFKYKISPHAKETLMIKTDSEAQRVNYQPEIFNLNKFEINCKVKVVPIDIALSQKIEALMNREMGRDIFDISSLTPKTGPNYQYLKAVLGVEDSRTLKHTLMKRCAALDLKKLCERVKPFIFKEDDINRILYFKDFLKQHQF